MRCRRGNARNCMRRLTERQGRLEIRIIWRQVRTLIQDKGVYMVSKMKTDQKKKPSKTTEHVCRERDETDNPAGEKQPDLLCPVAKRCGGCQWTGMDYQRQLKEKEKRVRKILAPYCRLEGILGMEHLCNNGTRFMPCSGRTENISPYPAFMRNGRTGSCPWTAV